jgi:hypothetical protein
MKIEKMDISKVFVVILTYPHNTVPVELMLWLMDAGFTAKQIGFQCEKGPYDIVRNHTLKFFEKRLDEFEWLLFIDNDMKPYQATNMFLSEQEGYDVVACNYDCANKAAHAMPDAFHMGMVRVKISKIKELIAKDPTKPLFMMPRNAENTAIMVCECYYFAERLKNEVGAKIIRIGHCNHSK